MSRGAEIMIKVLLSFVKGSKFLPDYHSSYSRLRSRSTASMSAQVFWHSGGYQLVPNAAKELVDTRSAQIKPKRSLGSVTTGLEWYYALVSTKGSRIGEPSERSGRERWPWTRPTAKSLQVSFEKLVHNECLLLGIYLHNVDAFSIAVSVDQERVRDNPSSW